MNPLMEQLYNALGGLAGADGLSRLFYMLFPSFLIFELPMMILVMLGVLRWFARRRSRVPKISVYQPRVSCIITCYSEGMDVQATLLSLCEQTYGGHIEMIPVVDGATVNQATLAAVRSFNVDPQLYPRRHLRPIAKWQRGGRVSSLNAGLSLASGEIVMALDGDTSFDNNMVSAIVRHFEDPMVPAVAGSLRVRNVWGSWVTAMQSLEYLLSIHMSKIGLAEWNLVNNVSGAFGAFRRSFLVKIGGWNTHTAEDLDLTLRIKSYFKRHDLRIPFEPEAIGHTDAPATLSQFLMQRLRWDGDLFFLYIRKHNRNISPKLLGWKSFLMILVTGFFFQLVLPFIIFSYTLLAIFILPGMTLLFLFSLIYLLYLTITVLMFGAMLLMVSDRPRQDMTLGLLVPFFPMFMLLLRCWSVVAMLNEMFRRGHEESSMAPWWVLKRATRF
ncbi:glycosyltransferase family 2 protein [Pseudomonas moorei]|jgi:cellulose synthase/poly-beta-1,6-N-acetylglucosamine synthase-like glycosyltransferase|uniref:Glycosyltransferase, catalytic subunit of cellulose synthase and poly-beta-1,6-N-acetylglucosamine synthase n=1 Tax=Pseudomonas moorei TaxID=395599 RepID=A0A1H1DJ25_9PSED|nr:glycosyltransferase [Pseudomonas moorei]KAB0503863.1 glycosyltransferase family 2 protein [Pseudomonas moorei]SDQ76427.1 Glycosyltransferase, catalytic subunit of cellulose synthase and poly-beta-1,6-N-acetylglucosamine synthase [Pseudomonas moorei]